MGKLLPKEEDEVEVVQLIGIVLRRPPAKLRRGRASMVGEERELLHGLARERKVWRVGGGGRGSGSEQRGAQVTESSG